MPRTQRRRALLASLATAGTASLAGCGEAGFPGPPDAIPVSVSNEDITEHTVTVTVTDESGEAVVSADATLGAEVDSQLTDFENPEENLDYTVSVRLASDVSKEKVVPVGGASGTRSIDATIEPGPEVRVSFLRT
ncbi:hypothetical protein [Salinirubrum litoreum]|uniref:Uncharacterized protein n=1 Tax=Salinirubrum litoreum TaxID=1126234 RepID=A0ABD5R9M3_9EURY|nr:hypothetical protein [Salinirubrum litoreum]